MIKVMCNTSPIIGLSMIGKLDLLWDLFDVTIPKEVYNEIVNGDVQSIGSNELEEAVSSGNIKVYTVEDIQFVNKAYGILHRGELEVVIGALENDIKVVLIDEKAARSFAETLNLKPLGILGILRNAKIQGKIEVVKPSLDKLIQYKFRISEKLYYDILKSVNEI